MGTLSWWDLPVPVLVIGASVWISRLLLETRLKATVQHEFDVKLQKLKADTDLKLETMRDTLRSREADIVALRSGALESLSKRHGVIMDRRIKAIDQLLEALQDRKKVAFITSLLGRLNITELEKIASDSTTKATFKKLHPDAAESLKVRSPAWRAQPYVSPLAWAFFRAYDVLMTSASLYAYLISEGGDVRVVDKEGVSNAVKTALPLRQQEIDEGGWNAALLCADELEEELIAEIARMLEGADLDDAQIKSAHSILAAVSTVASKSHLARNYADQNFEIPSNLDDDGILSQFRSTRRGGAMAIHKL